MKKEKVQGGLEMFSLWFISDRIIHQPIPVYYTTKRPKVRGRNIVGVLFFTNVQPNKPLNAFKTSKIREEGGSTRLLLKFCVFDEKQEKVTFNKHGCCCYCYIYGQCRNKKQALDIWFSLRERERGHLSRKNIRVLFFVISYYYNCKWKYYHGHSSSSSIIVVCTHTHTFFLCQAYVVVYGRKFCFSAKKHLYVSLGMY